MTNDKCDAGATSADTFKVGGILPITGNLAFLGPPEIAGVGLAVSEINAAGGVNGAGACYQMEDSGDTTDLAVSSNSADKLIQGKPVRRHRCRLVQRDRRTSSRRSPTRRSPRSRRPTPPSR